MPSSTKHFFNLTLLTFLITLTQSYLQFKLHRIPNQQGKKLKQQQYKCPQSLNALADADYKEVCYDKDISYSFELYSNSKIYLISADFTTPISWIKGENCKLEGTKYKCLLIQRNIKDTIKSLTVDRIKEKLKFKHHKVHAHKAQSDKIPTNDRQQDDSDSQQQQDTKQNAQIQGSSNIIKGHLQKPAHLSFQIMDSNRLTRLVDILLLGFYVLGEKDALQLQSTQFINASSIPFKLNEVSDGGISLRFDQNSQNSFLNQIFAYTKAEQKIATLYLGQNSYLALGELSLKFSQHGYSGITWVKVQQDDNFGKIPTLKQIIVADRQHEIEKKISIDKPVVLTLSASYIGMHSDLAQKINSKLSKSASCQFQQHGYLRCNYSKKTDKDKDFQKQLTFSFGQSSISLDFKDLILHQESKYVIFNIKQLFQQDYLVLGEPIFKKYTLYLDYGQEKVGFAIKRQHFQKQFINVVTLIRFLVFIFTIGIFLSILGCCFILCSAPCRVLWNHLVSRKISPKILGKQGIRLKQYSPINQNAYDQISDRIKSITTSRETTQVDGHPDDSI